MERKYISATSDFNTIKKHVCAPLFKKVFSCDKPSDVNIEISVVGFYRLFLNGKDITKGFLAPYISNPDDVVFYDKYDVTKRIRTGENVLCVLLGNGFVNSNDFNCWDFEKASYRSAPCFFLNVYAGDDIILSTDENFLWTESPITFDDLRCGEHYDARRESDLCDKSFDGYKKPVVKAPPKGDRIQSYAEPLKEKSRLRVRSIEKTSFGYIYDFGEDNTGLYILKIDADEGQKIRLTFGEVIKDEKVDQTNISFAASVNGYVQTDEYICKKGPQTYTPSFTIHGFRYVFVEGLKAEQATIDLLEYIVIHSDLRQTGRFKCNNECVDRIQEITLRSDLSNFLYYPTDCPQREKNGWTADAAISAEQVLYNFDALRSYKQWLYCIRKAQRKDGALPGIIPTSGWGFTWGNGPAWDKVLIELPYMLYRFYGDKEIISDNIGSILKYFEYIESKINENGLIDCGLGDWCQTYTASEGDYETPVEVTDTLTIIDCVYKTEYMLAESGLLDTLSQLKTRLIGAFRNKYIKEGRLTIKTQTALSMALILDVLKNDEKDIAYEELIELIHKNDDHFRVGVIGYVYLFECLAKRGDHELCLKLITNDSFPSYGFLVGHGATTLWEWFANYRSDEDICKNLDAGIRVPSLNHHFWGAISAWFYKYIVGLRIVSADEIVISPCIFESVNKVNAEFERNGNALKIAFVRSGSQMVLSIVNDGFKGKIIFGSTETELRSGDYQIEL